MSIYRRGDDDEQSDHEDLWRELAERVCHVPGWEQRPGDPRRAYHQDLPGLCDIDLDLEKQRAVFRACLERNRLDRAWLLERIARIDAEQEQRAEAGACRPPSPPALTPWPEAAVARRDTPRRFDPRIREEAERLQEEWQHQEWLRHQRASGMTGAPGGDGPWRVIPGGAGRPGQERAE